jgi:hypothetical protein
MHDHHPPRGETPQKVKHENCVLDATHHRKIFWSSFSALLLPDHQLEIETRENQNNQSDNEKNFSDTHGRGKLKQHTKRQSCRNFARAIFVSIDRYDVQSHVRALRNVVCMIDR